MACWGGEDYRARQNAFKERESLVKNAFDQQMISSDELESDIDNEDAHAHKRVKAAHGRDNLGRRPRMRRQRKYEAAGHFDYRRDQAQANDIAMNERYLADPEWIRDSRFGRSEWDRLVTDGPTAAAPSITGAEGRSRLIPR